MKLSIKEILKATGGALKRGDENAVVKSISTDTRRLKKGDFYVALKGPRFDGHNFVGDAIAKGACGVLVDREIDSKLLTVKVSDTLKALGDLASCWRKKFSIPVVAITGSSGKTITKDMLAVCLEQSGEVCKAEGNYNNLIGLPLTMMSLDKRHKYAVWEMGMNAFGEIARLTEIAKPTIGMVTNVGRAHLEGVGNIEGVIKAKSELFFGLGPGATAIVNADDSNIFHMKTEAKKFSFGFSKKADVCCIQTDYFRKGTKVKVRSPNQEAVFELPVVGKYHVMNFLASYAVCTLLGLGPCEVQKGVKNFRQSKMRGEEIQLKNDILVVNDSYNANPDSVKAAVSALNLQFSDRRKVVLLGEMLELGDETALLHTQVGQEISGNGIDLLLAYGEHSREVIEGYAKNKKCRDVTCYVSTHAFDKMSAFNQKLKSLLKNGDVVLVKGSRGTQMERVVEFLKKN